MNKKTEKDVYNPSKKSSETLALEAICVQLKRIADIMDRKIK